MLGMVAGVEGKALVVLSEMRVVDTEVAGRVVEVLASRLDVAEGPRPVEDEAPNEDSGGPRLDGEVDEESELAGGKVSRNDEAAGKVLEVEFLKKKEDVVELVRSIESTLGEEVAVLNISVVDGETGVVGKISVEYVLVVLLTKSMVVDRSGVDESVVDDSVISGSVVDDSVVDDSMMAGSVVDDSIVDDSVVVGSVVVDEFVMDDDSGTIVEDAVDDILLVIAPSPEVPLTMASGKNGFAPAFG
ncbi:hypothetical protein Daus18300_005536 [Diaporthe australafricana]|uniref:Uncharacterized protein n=1 Tax=Diaporthe australafricana TaxID=127596 RepID=A0ABR3X0J1_9PEZI